MSRFLDKRFAALQAYVPGEQPKDMEYVKLNTNESPYPPSPGVLARLGADAERLNLYPQPECTVMREKLAGRYNVGPDNIYLGNGSDEVLAFAFSAFCGEDTPAVFPDITYGLYPIYCALYGVKPLIKPLRPDFSINIADYAPAGGTVILPNPNAPTGLALTASEIAGIAGANPDNVVIIDEAYVDFGAESAVPLTAEFENLLIIHTYSKSRSMAGMRLAYAIGSAELIADMNTIKYSINPYNIDRLAMAAGETALDEREYYDENCARIIQTRSETAVKLRELGFELTDSKANFLFARSDRVPGGELYKKLKEQGVLVRWFDSPRTRDWVRISIGTPGQMETLLDAIKRILEEKA